MKTQTLSFFLFIFFFFLFSNPNFAQKSRVLFDATRAEMAGNADWIVDADKWNLKSENGKMVIANKGGEANPQRFPTPPSSGISSNTPETYWKGALSAWAVALVKQNCDVETLPFDGRITYGDKGNQQDLANYQLFVICEPNIKFSKSEKDALLKFVQNGGGLFLVGDHEKSDRNNDGCDSPCVLNDFFNTNNDPFGIVFEMNSFSETSNNVKSDSKELVNGKMGKVSSIKFSAGASLQINPAKNKSVRGAIFRKGSSVSGNSGVLCAYSQYGSGRIVVLGDSSPADDGTGDSQDKLYTGWEEQSGDHAKLIINASLWLLKK